MSTLNAGSRVYVIGAGFSAGLGYPMTNDLLVKVWDRLDPEFRSRLARVIAFHHPDFDEHRRTSFPDLEPLLSLMEVNRQLFAYTRPATGKFSPIHARKATEELLWHIAKWFEEIHNNVRSAAHPWLELFCQKVRDDRSTIRPVVKIA